jgi:hypothetical protein
MPAMAEGDAREASTTGEAEDGKAGAAPPQDAGEPPRRDFRETALFLPDPTTAPDGSLSFTFTMPEVLTRWKLLGLAHTPDLMTARLERTAVTSKPMMVRMLPPRALREDDRITLRATVSVREGEALEGTAQLHLSDPADGRSLADAFGFRAVPVTFIAAPEEDALLEWELQVPAGIDAVAVRVAAEGHRRPGPMVAAGAGLRDSEEHVLPILPHRVLVTESLPFFVDRPGTHTFRLENLLRSAGDTGIQHRELLLDFSPEPIWEVVQALPYLMEQPRANTEQAFNRYMANTLAAHLVATQPPLARFIAMHGEDDGPKGALEDHADVRRTLLEESPWVLQGRDESERRSRLARLLDKDRLAREERNSLYQLLDQQLSSGAWPWFPGMGPSRRITQYVVAGAGRLDRLGAADLRADGRVQQMLRRAVHWLDREVAQQHADRQRHGMAERHVPGYDDVQYLFARSHFPHWPADAGTRAAADALRSRLREGWMERSLQEQAMIAIALHRTGDRATPGDIIRSLRERATRSDALGMYWRGAAAGPEWATFPTSTHAVLLEAFHEVGRDSATVRDLKRHLITLKRGTDWGNSLATAEALHALLQDMGTLLPDGPAPTVTVGGSAVPTPAEAAATGRFVHAWPAESIRPAMGRVEVTTTGHAPVWGGLHWSSMQTPEQARPSQGTALRLQRRLFVERSTKDGNRLVPVGPEVVPTPGERIVVRLVLESDRWLDHVHLKDPRAAGVAPEDVLSGMRHYGRLGGYMAVRDAATHFFFERVPPGTHVIEHAVRASHTGDMGQGLATVECMYAPAFAAHAAGERIRIAAGP